MTNDSWERAKSTLALALEVPVAEREVLIASTCGADRDLADEVRAWLAAHDESGDFIETPIFSQAHLARPSRSGDRIGNYTVIREIGFGGMGAVYLAERGDGEFQQRVAIKVVRQSIADPYLLERFRSERQILASLQHPNIGHLLDGGVTTSGEPFLVMEFIDGKSLLDHVSAEKLDLKAKLHLFLKICSALSYAHRNLVIHRDIKPGNILVDADGEPKLLDFGLAKLIDQGGTATSTTQTAVRALTPAYASPEQLTDQKVTTASDIYGLGVVLYELLTDKKPFAREGLSFDQISRSLDVEAEAPSTHVTSLRGDLDNIILMAIRREPERRYESVDALAADVERYLNGLPVAARPNTLRYTSLKFISRHRVVAMAAAMIVIALVTGTGLSVWQARKAERERAKATAVNDFLQTMLGYTDTSTRLVRANNHETTVNDVLQYASARLGSGELSTEPETKAELHRIIGSSYLTQGRYDEAETNLRAALDLKTQIYGAQSPEVLAILVDLAQLYVTTSRFAEAEKIYDQRLTILRTAEKDGSIDPTYLMVALNDYAVLRRAEGDSATAEELMRQCLALEPRVPPEAVMLVGVAKAVYALVLTDSGRFDEAELIVRQRIDSIRGLPQPGTIELASNLTALGGILIEKGNSREALDDLAEAETIYRKLTDPMHLPLGDNLRSQARAYLDVGDLARAQAKIDEALSIYRQSSRPNFINYPTALTIKAGILLRQGKYADSESVMNEAMTLRDRDLPKGHFLTAVSRETLAEIRLQQGKRAEAESLLKESLADLEASQIEGSPRLVRIRAMLTGLGNAASRHRHERPLQGYDNLTIPPKIYG